MPARRVSILDTICAPDEDLGTQATVGAQRRRWETMRKEALRRREDSGRQASVEAHPHRWEKMRKEALRRREERRSEMRPVAQESLKQGRLEQRHMEQEHSERHTRPPFAVMARMASMLQAICTPDADSDRQAIVEANLHRWEKMRQEAVRRREERRSEMRRLAQESLKPARLEQGHVEQERSEQHSRPFLAAVVRIASMFQTVCAPDQDLARQAIVDLHRWEKMRLGAMRRREEERLEQERRQAENPVLAVLTGMASMLLTIFAPPCAPDQGLGTEKVDLPALQCERQDELGNATDSPEARVYAPWWPLA